MTEREKQIKALLEKARKIQGGFVHEDSDCDCFACQTVDIIDQILALLPEPCPTCGGSGKLHCKSVTPGTINCPDCTESQEPCPTCGGSKIEYLGTDNQGFVVLATTRKHYAIPCPDCQSQEPATEYQRTADVSTTNYKGMPESKEPDHIPEAEKKVGTGEFVKKVKRAIVDLVTVAPDDEEAAREAIVVLYNACDRLEALQTKLEAAKKRENYVECLEAGLRDRDTKLKVAFDVISMLKEKGIG